MPEFLSNGFEQEKITDGEHKEVERLEEEIKEKIPQFLTDTSEVFDICRAPVEVGIAFYASDPKTRYPWIYSRDFSCLIHGLAELKDFQSAKEGCRFLLSCQLENGQWVQRYDEKRERKDAKVQEDCTPLSIWAILSYIRESEDLEFAKEVEPQLRKAANHIEDENIENLKKYSLVHSTTSLHEAFDPETKEPINKGFEVWNNSVTVKAFELLDEVYHDQHFRGLAEQIESGIKTQLVNEGRFIRRLTDNGKKDLAPDIMSLAPTYFGIFDEPEMQEINKNTIDYLYENLWDKELGGMRRLPGYDCEEEHPGYQGTLDPLLPGPWIFYTAWLAQDYIKVGNRERGIEILYWILDQRQQGKLAEHLVSKENFIKYGNREREYHEATKKGQPLESAFKNLDLMAEQVKIQDKLNYSWPLAWSHLETLRALNVAGLISEFKIH